MPQLAYFFNPPAGVEGLQADIREAQVVISSVAQGLVPVGKMAYDGTNSEVGINQNAADPQSGTPGQIIAYPSGVSATNPISLFQFAGIPLFDASRQAYDTSLGFAAYSNQDPVPLLIHGVCWVKPEQSFSNVATGVFIRVAPSGSFTTLGAFSPVSGTGLVSMGGLAQWMSATNTSTGLAILELF